MGESKFLWWFSGGVTIVEVAYEVIYNALKILTSYILTPIANGSPLGSCSPGQKRTDTLAEWIQFPGQSFEI